MPTPTTSPAVPKTFADHAKFKLLDLFAHHDNEVGSQLYKEDPVKYHNYKQTDCITYGMNCMTYAFKQLGDEDSAKKIWHYIVSGADVAAYLVQVHNWECIYINADTRNPADGDSEHPFSYQMAKKYCKYYKLPVSFMVVDYNPTKPDESTPIANPTPENSADIGLLKNIQFGFGLSRGAMHTWTFSGGDVYEVHWCGIGADLYEKTPLKTFAWLSGAIVVPPETARSLRAAGLRTCRQ